MLYQTHLVWEDEIAPIASGGFDKIDKFNNMDNPRYPLKGVKYVTQEPDDFYWPLNHVEFHFSRYDEDTVLMYINTVTPNFDYFDIFVETDEAPVKFSKNLYKLIAFDSSIFVKSVNKFGMKGNLAQIFISRVQ